MRYQTFLLSMDVVSSTLHLIVIKKPVDFIYRPGQFINLLIGEGLIRSYSLCSDPDEENLKLLIKFPDGSRARVFFESALSEDRSIEIMGPFGRYRYQDTPFEKVHIVTGAGIGPNWSMLKFWARMGAVSPTTVFWGVRTFDSIPDPKSWLKLVTDYSNLRLFLCVTKEATDRLFDGIMIRRGRVLDVIEKNMDDFSNKEFYICGQPEMIDSVVAYLKNNGVEDNFIFYESFNAASDVLKK